jgi:hypothetical protein
VNPEVIMETTNAGHRTTPQPAGDARPDPRDAAPFFEGTLGEALMARGRPRRVETDNARGRGVDVTRSERARISLQVSMAPLGRDRPLPALVVVMDPVTRFVHDVYFLPSAAGSQP